MICSLSFCSISPCMADTVKLASFIFSASQSTCNQILWYNNQHDHIYLSSGIAEEDGLSNGKSIVEIDQSIEFPFLTINGNEELLDSSTQILNKHKLVIYYN